MRKARALRAEHERRISSTLNMVLIIQKWARGARDRAVARRRREELRHSVQHLLGHVYWDVISPPLFAEALWKKMVNRTLRPVESTARALVRHTYETVTDELSHAHVHHFATVPVSPVSPPGSPDKQRFRRPEKRRTPKPE